ncbi:hypothetical protein [Chryseobacterium sp. JK1]|uniref:hypothetical protein n=1 Tax=Chryseobacterium sp. JK1 TaxID=874294 RepID=UPI003D686896
METIAQHQELLQYSEAYISDMLMLKNIFLQNQEHKKIDSNFGLPFFLAKKKNTTIAFASLTVNEKNEISFKIYHEKGVSETEMSSFYARALSYFKKNNTPNFRDPEQLESSIKSMIDWLNFE